jgi:hypothetical protein
MSPILVPNADVGPLIPADGQHSDAATSRMLVIVGTVLLQRTLSRRRTLIV